MSVEPANALAAESQAASHQQFGLITRPDYQERILLHVGNRSQKEQVPENTRIGRIASEVVFRIFHPGCSLIDSRVGLQWVSADSHEPVEAYQPPLPCESKQQSTAGGRQYHPLIRTYGHLKYLTHASR